MADRLQGERRLSHRSRAALPLFGVLCAGAQERPRLFAMTRRRDRYGGRHGPGGRGWRRRRSGRRTRHAAPIHDEFVRRIEITDPHHPLFGRLLDVNQSPASVRPGWVAVILPDGRSRWVKRAATSLENAGESLPSHALPLVSVRTLVPLAQYIRTLMAAQELADGTAHPCDEGHGGTGSSGPIAHAGAEALARPVADGAAAIGEADRGAAPGEIDGRRRGNSARGGSC
jgi:hypothetical protein